MTDVPVTVMDILLRYMYTGKVDPELNPRCLISIIYGADKYGLKELEDYCFVQLVNNCMVKHGDDKNGVTHGCGTRVQSSAGG